MYNEAAGLRTTIASLLAQEVEGGLELLVVDGCSTDGSAEIAGEMARADPRIRVLRNSRRSTPFALNQGLQASRCEYVGILGAHAAYAPNYLAICLSEMAERNVVGCSGRVLARPANGTLGARLAYWVLSHPFGVSTRSFRTQPEGYADTIPYPVFKRGPLLELEGYDPAMTRNQDNDLYFRLRRAGYRLYSTWRTSCEYRTRATIGQLMGYARSNGFWCGISWRRAPGSLSWRHYAPPFFVAVAALGAIMVPVALIAGRPLAVSLLGLAPLAGHLAGGHLAALSLMRRERNLATVLTPWLFLGFHCIYGLAFFAGAVAGDPDDPPTLH